MAVEPYQAWVDNVSTRLPVELFDAVIVKAYGEGATGQDVGKTGVVVKINRTRVVVSAGDWSITVRPSVLRLLSRQKDRWCPVCAADRGDPCVVTGEPGKGRPMVLMHSAR